MVYTYLYLFRELQTRNDNKWLCCEPLDENGLPKPFKLTSVHEDFKLITGAGNAYCEDSIADHIDCIGVSYKSEPVTKYLEEHVRKYAHDGDVGIDTSNYYDMGALTLTDISKYLDKMSYLLNLTGYLPTSLISEDEEEAIDILRRYENGCFEKTADNKMELYRKLFANNPVRRFYDELMYSKVEGEAFEYCNNSTLCAFNTFNQLSSTIHFKQGRIVFWYQDM